MTTAVVLIPQGMAYAMVAGLPPIHGLYASLLPLVAYALVGRSRQLAVGPGALDSLLVGAALASQAFVTASNYAAYAALLALLVAGIQIGLAALRAGFLVNFLSRPVVSGFTTGAAVLIAGSQLHNLVGIDARPGLRLHEQVIPLVENLHTLHLVTAIVGVGSAVAIVALKRWKKTFPGPLAVVGVAVVVSAWGNLEALGVDVVGPIPRGLPSFVLPAFGWDEVRALLPTAFAAAFVGYLTVISIAQTFANRNHYVITANRELLATGTANLVSGLTQGFPISASFSRSAVHAGAGATSRFALLAVAACVAISVFALTDLFALLPRATLAAIIITAVWGLIDLQAPRRLWRIKRADMWLLVLTSITTLFAGIEPGILAGVAASVGLMLFRTTRPHAAVMGRLPGTTDYRNVRNHPSVEQTPGVLILRIDAQFYFGNVTFLQTLLRRLEADSASPLRAVVLDASSLNQLDSSANDALDEIVADYQRRDISFAMASVKEPVAAVMRASGLHARIGAEHLFRNVHDAVTAVTHDALG